MVSKLPGELVVAGVLTPMMATAEEGTLAQSARSIGTNVFGEPRLVRPTKAVSAIKFLGGHYQDRVLTVDEFQRMVEVSPDDPGLVLLDTHDMAAQRPISSDMDTKGVKPWGERL